MGEAHHQPVNATAQQRETSSRGILQRKCDCGQLTTANTCDRCEKRGSLLQRSAIRTGPAEVPAAVHEVLQSSGEPLDVSTRHYFEPRLGHDFSRVRVHTGTRARESARAVNALAYTVGERIVIGDQPQSATSRQNLLAHELTHVVQQRGVNSAGLDHLSVDAPDSAMESEARSVAADFDRREHGSPMAHLPNSAPVLCRADPDAVGHTMTLGSARRTGLQFFPTNLTDTRVGPVSARPGLLGGGAARLNVIIGENLTPRRLAQQLLPLWITATPFTPAGAAAPVPLTTIGEEELAKALLVYNDGYLPVPAMTSWRAGLNFPLPIDIDPGGVGTLNPDDIRALAGGFNPAWMPLLDLRATAVAAAPAATLQADVTAFLGQRTTAFARGLALGTRALTNPTAELPFVRETFRQLGAAGFDVALAFVDNILAEHLRLLAAQGDGAAILMEVGTVLGNAPGPLTPAQQATFDRLNLAMATTPAVAPPAAARTRAEKTITVDTVKLEGSTHNPSTDVAMANAILSQCNVRVQQGANQTASHDQTMRWLGGNTDLHSANNCHGASVEERRMVQGATTDFGLNARFRAFFVGTFTGVNGSGYSCTPDDAPVPTLRNTAVIQNDADTDSLSHELGHILINLGPHTATGLMSGRPALPARRVDEISDPHCTRMYNHA